MAYLNASKVAQIKSRYQHTMGHTALAYLLTELQAMEAAIVAGGGIDWGEVGDVASVAAAKAAGASTEFARADHAHDIGSGALDTGLELNSGKVRIASGAFRPFHFAGVAAAGPVTATGAKVGDVVLFVTNLSDIVDGASSFETTVTVVDQIQQTNVADLSTKKFFALLLSRS